MKPLYDMQPQLPDDIESMHSDYKKLTFYRQCNNSSEFKAKVKQLCKELGIHMIRGRPYHPQTQGTVERANQTFKKRLGALQAQKRLSGSTWAVLLLELALVINTTTT